MKSILITRDQIKILQRNIARGRFENVKESLDWPFFLELLEQTNEVNGYEVIQNLGGRCFPRPTFIDGYKHDGLLGQQVGQVHSFLFKHRQMMSLDLCISIKEIHASLLKNKDYKGAMQDVLSLSMEMIKDKTELSLVSGPISSGGLNDIEKNLRRFNKAVVGVANQNFKVFNQMPFENLFSLMHNFGCDSDFFIDEFYQPIMFSGKFFKLHQMFDWQTSKGARRENYMAKEANMEIVPINFSLSLTERVPIAEFDGLEVH